MSAVGITENAKGDNKKFEIWYNSREEVYIVQVPHGILSFPVTDFVVGNKTKWSFYVSVYLSMLYAGDDGYNELQSRADCCITAVLVQVVK